MTNDLPGDLIGTKLPGCSAADQRREKAYERAEEELTGTSESAVLARTSRWDDIFSETYPGCRDLLSRIQAAFSVTTGADMRLLYDHYKACASAVGKAIKAPELAVPPSRRAAAKAAFAMLLTALEQADEIMIQARADEILEPPE